MVNIFAFNMVRVNNVVNMTKFNIPKVHGSVLKDADIESQQSYQESPDHFERGQD